jgi:hypothetical protein
MNEGLFITKAFMLPGIQEKFNVWFDTNMIYCEGTCSFTHRCYEAFKTCKGKNEAINAAFQVLNDMRAEFLVGNYDIKSLKEAVKNINYEPPMDRFLREHMTWEIFVKSLEQYGGQK